MVASEETEGLRVHIETRREHELGRGLGVGQGPWYLSSKYRDPTSSKEGTGHGNLTPSKNVVISAEHPGL